MPEAEPARRLERLVHPSIEPATSLAYDHHLLRLVSDPPSKHGGFFRIYAFPGSIIWLGRYQAMPVARDGDNAEIYRRLTGGRNLPFGDGFVGLSIILPHRSALVSDDPLALAPHQVMNRCVRGLLQAFKSVGVPAFYPGRDLVTVDGRVLAAISFEVTSAGSLLFEALIATSGDFSATNARLERAGLRSAGWGAEDVTSIRQQLGVDLALEDVVKLLERGYAQQFHLQFSDTNPSPDERADPPVTSREWLRSRTVPASVDHHFVSPALLGVLEVYFSADPDGTIGELMLAGDYIANSASIAELEAELHGCALERTAIDAVVAAIFSKPENFILGIGDVAAIRELILSSPAWRRDVR